MLRRVILHGGSVLGLSQVCFVLAITDQVTSLLTKRTLTFRLKLVM